jgi:hypothetical protein
MTHLCDSTINFAVMHKSVLAQGVIICGEQAGEGMLLGPF